MSVDEKSRIVNHGHNYVTHCRIKRLVIQEEARIMTSRVYGNPLCKYIEPVLTVNLSTSVAFRNNDNLGVFDE